MKDLSKKWMVLGGLGCVAALLLLVVGSWAFRYYTAEVRGKVRAEEIIESAPNRMVQYEYFFNLCATIQGYNAQLQAQRQQLEVVKGEKEWNRVNANIAGITGQRARAIAQYNADVQKEYTRGRFFDPSLPSQISVGDANLTC
jgi:hypothetical protein